MIVAILAGSLRVSGKTSAASEQLLVHLLSAVSAQAGGLFLFDPRGAQEKLICASVQGDLQAPRLISAWKSLKPVVRARPAAPSPSSFGDSDSVYVPLMDGGLVAGFLYALVQDPVPAALLGELKNLLGNALCGLYRTALRERLASLKAPIDVVGLSDAFLEAERKVRRAAGSGAPILITGERGSGKELAGWAVHCWSKRSQQPFLPVLTSALPDNMIAAELFGHERHSFTGAERGRAGKFGAADGGTIFFDEIGDLDPATQSALLRVIEYNELSRVGSDRRQQVDVRIVAATNRNLHQMAAQGRFRADLCDRLACFEIRVPPLRQRRQDILPLADYFVKKQCHKVHRPLHLIDGEACQACQHASSAPCMTAEFAQALQAYDWPGNVRELKNLMLRLVAAHPNEVLDSEHVAELLRKRRWRSQATEPDMTLATATRLHIERVLRLTEGNQSQAARQLGLPLSTLRSKMKKLSIQA